MHTDEQDDMPTQALSTDAHRWTACDLAAHSSRDDVCETPSVRLATLPSTFTVHTIPSASLPTTKTTTWISSPKGRSGPLLDFLPGQLASQDALAHHVMFAFELDQPLAVRPVAPL